MKKNTYLTYLQVFIAQWLIQNHGKSTTNKNAYQFEQVEFVIFRSFKNNGG